MDGQLDNLLSAYGELQTVVTDLERQLVDAGLLHLADEQSVRNLEKQLADEKDKFSTMYEEMCGLHQVNKDQGHQLAEAREEIGRLRSIMAGTSNKPAFDGMGQIVSGHVEGSNTMYIKRISELNFENATLTAELEKAREEIERLRWKCEINECWDTAWLEHQIKLMHEDRTALTAERDALKDALKYTLDVWEGCNTLPQAEIDAWLEKAKAALLKEKP